MTARRPVNERELKDPYEQSGNYPAEEQPTDRLLRGDGVNHDGDARGNDHSHRGRGDRDAGREGPRIAASVHRGDEDGPDGGGVGGRGS